MAMGRRNKKTRGESERKTHSTCVKRSQRHRREEGNKEGEEREKRGRKRDKRGSGGEREAGSLVVSTSIR